MKIICTTENYIREKIRCDKMNCPFKRKHLRVSKNGFCTAHDVDGWLKKYGEKYDACEIRSKRVIGGAQFETIEYCECVGEDVCPLLK